MSDNEIGGVITEYLININTGQNWISKQEAIKLSLEGKLRATIFHRKAGTYYLRPEYGSKSFELII